MASMDKLVSLAKRRGFIFPSSEIYGGLNGCWDYGPLGVELKRNVKDAWWEDMVSRHDCTAPPQGAPTAFDMVGLDCSILMNSRVWEASGHVGGFNDPMVDCRETKGRYRADQLVVFGVVAGDDPDSSVAETEHLFATPGEVGALSADKLAAPHRKRLRRLVRNLPGHRLVTLPNALQDEDLRARTFAPGATEPGSLTAPANLQPDVRNSRGSDARRLQRGVPAP